MTATAALIAAALLQGAIALVLLWILGAIRVPLVVSGKMPVGAIALSREPWPEREAIAEANGLSLSLTGDCPLSDHHTGKISIHGQTSELQSRPSKVP